MSVLIFIFLVMFVAFLYYIISASEPDQSTVEPKKVMSNSTKYGLMRLIKMLFFS